MSGSMGLFEGQHISTLKSAGTILYILYISSCQRDLHSHSHLQQAMSTRRYRHHQPVCNSEDTTDTYQSQCCDWSREDWLRGRHQHPDSTGIDRICISGHYRCYSLGPRTSVCEHTHPYEIDCSQWHRQNTNQRQGCSHHMSWRPTYM